MHLPIKTACFLLRECDRIWSDILRTCNSYLSRHFQLQMKSWICTIKTANWIPPCRPVDGKLFPYSKKKPTQWHLFWFARRHPNVENRPLERPTHPLSHHNCGQTATLDFDKNDFKKAQELYEHLNFVTILPAELATLTSKNAKAHV